MAVEGWGEVEWVAKCCNYSTLMNVIPILTKYSFAVSDTHSKFKNCEQFFKETFHLFGCTDGSDRYEQVVHLEAGYYMYPFKCKLPAALPPSFFGPYGAIRYMVSATLEYPTLCVIAIERPFKIVVYENHLKDFPISKEHKSEVGCLLWFTKPLFIAASLQSTLYEAGDEITVAIELVNRSTKYTFVKAITVELIQVVVYKR
jgi:hypothetical protein